MRHMVYHEKYKPIIVEDEDYVAMLQSGEWFDNPSLDSGGIKDEIKRYEKWIGPSEETARNEQEHKLIRKDAGSQCKSESEPRQKEKVEPKSSIKAAKSPSKKRGRPPKKK